MLFEQASDPESAGDPSHQPAAHREGANVGHRCTVFGGLELERLLAVNERASQMLERDLVGREANHFDGAVGEWPGRPLESGYHRVVVSDEQVGMVGHPGAESGKHLVGLKVHELDGFGSKGDRSPNEEGGDAGDGPER